MWGLLSCSILFIFKYLGLLVKTRAANLCFVVSETVTINIYSIVFWSGYMSSITRQRRLGLYQTSCMEPFHVVVLLSFVLFWGILGCLSQIFFSCESGNKDLMELQKCVETSPDSPSARGWAANDRFHFWLNWSFNIQSTAATWNMERVGAMGAEAGRCSACCSLTWRQ